VRLQEGKSYFYEPNLEIPVNSIVVILIAAKDLVLSYGYEILRPQRSLR
jgi:hypothetical protein